MVKASILAPAHFRVTPMVELLMVVLQTVVQPMVGLQTLAQPQLVRLKWSKALVVQCIWKQTYPKASHPPQTHGLVLLT